MSKIYNLSLRIIPFDVFYFRCQNCVFYIKFIQMLEILDQFLDARTGPSIDLQVKNFQIRLGPEDAVWNAEIVVC